MLKSSHSFPPNDIFLEEVHWLSTTNNEFIPFLRSDWYSGRKGKGHGWNPLGDPESQSYYWPDLDKVF